MEKKFFYASLFVAFILVLCQSTSFAKDLSKYTADSEVYLNLVDTGRSWIVQDPNIVGAKQCLTIFFNPQNTVVQMVGEIALNCETEVQPSVWLSFVGAGLAVSYVGSNETCYRKLMKEGGSVALLQSIDCSSVSAVFQNEKEIIQPSIMVGASVEFRDPDVIGPNNCFTADLNTTLSEVVRVSMSGVNCSDTTPTAAESGIIIKYALDWRLAGGAERYYREVRKTNGISPIVDSVAPGTIDQTVFQSILRDWSRWD